MAITRRPPLSSSEHNGLRLLWLSLVSLSLAFCIAATAAEASDRGYHARLSSDRDAILRGAAAAPAGGIDVILTGSPDFITRIATRHGASIKKSIQAGGVLTITPAQLLALANDAEITSLSLDATMHGEMADVVQVTGAAAAWHGEIAKLGAVTGRGIGVAIIDTGVANHTALAGRLLASFDFTRDHITVTPAADLNGHGTHVAGIVAAGLPRVGAASAPLGMAPDATILSLKVLEADGSGQASNVVEAIDFAVANKATYGLRIINLSLGTAATQSWRDDPVCQAVERATRAGILVVASAGNRGQGANGQMVMGSVTSPGISPFAVTVGALRTNGTLDRSDDTVAPWSSKGPVDAGARAP